MLIACLLCVAITATPSPSPSPTATRRDPCGGAQALLKKYLAASPCVFIAGEASIQSTYATTKIPAGVVLDTASTNATVNATRWALGYPGTLINIGVTHNAQIAFIPPSFSEVTSARGVTLAAGSTDMEFWYKQLMYVDSVRGILGGVLLIYAAPTGSPGLAAPGPEYTINPLLNIATNKARNIGVSLAFPVVNASTSSGATRTWTFIPQAVPYWRSPGGTLLALVVSHNFTSNVTPLLINSAQLVARRFQLQATYGGVNSPLDFTNPIEGVARATGTSYSRTLTFGASVMFGSP
ncbi:MAG: hypothetical protein WBD74_07095 [Candidatus Aquilonibacter sp.]